jgi:hypothetical protein
VNARDAFLLELLTPRQRKLVTLLREGETLADAAAVVGVSEGRALQMLDAARRNARLYEGAPGLLAAEASSGPHDTTPGSCKHCGQSTGSPRRQSCDRCAPASERRRRKRRRSETHCAWCGVPLTPAIAALDHIVPVAGGGTDDPHNLTPACAQCNSSKCDTPLVVWLAKRAHARSA